MNLDEVTRELGRHYRAWKDEEKLKEKFKKEFLKAVSEHLAEETPQRFSEIVEAPTKESALRSAQRKFGRYEVKEVSEVEPGHWELVLEEDPTLKPFTYVNKEDEHVYSKVIAEGGPSLQDDELKEECPELWDEITVEVTNRVLKPMDELTPEQVAAIQPYITTPVPQVKLGPPRKAKPEELEDEDNNRS